ncbi:MAG: 6-phosphofructokinase [Oscillospiraceae bacterium]|jgi:6-phosphofructokinase 1|nr:6-phosphofructokinase [Oscillospiraceae bacterium]
MKCKTVAVLTSGGDAPGMNAAIRAVVRSSISKGIRPLGVMRGYSGIVSRDVFEMSIQTVSDIIERGGTILYTARSPELLTEEGILKAAKACRDMKIDGVIVIGGDGSAKAAHKLSEKGIRCVCLPGTIDNDIACSENSIGFDTAVNTAMFMIDKIRDTAQSHDRCSVVEVMGRKCGNIALHVGIAVGATSILIPECDFDFEKDIIERIFFSQKMGKKHFIIIVAEGLKIASKITSEITKRTKIESRATILGHVQRGGPPTAFDRIIASEMGCYAVELLFSGIGNKVIITKNNKISSVDISTAINSKEEFNLGLYKKALEISM